MRAACLFSNEQWEHSNQRGVVRVCARTCTSAHSPVRTAGWFPQQQASTRLPSLRPLAPPPPPHSKPTHTFMPLIPLFLIVPYAPRKESIETQSVFLMPAPARRSLAAAASFISSAAPLAEAFYCVLRGNTVTRETRDSSQPTISSLSLFRDRVIGEIQFKIMAGKEMHFIIDGGNVKQASLAASGFSAGNLPSKSAFRVISSGQVCRC